MFSLNISASKLTLQKTPDSPYKFMFINKNAIVICYFQPCLSAWFISWEMSAYHSKDKQLEYSSELFSDFLSWQIVLFVFSNPSNILFQKQAWNRKKSRVIVATCTYWYQFTARNLLYNLFGSLKWRPFNSRSPSIMIYGIMG